MSYTCRRCGELMTALSPEYVEAVVVLYRRLICFACRIALQQEET
ncbi:hypothetical protein ACFP47_10300 [Nesterenkonia lacusekhoensis]|uniref:Uncharacterized protein n=1 Tax=Nesterenkonia lacusekhoensis TaxID=150832 RepID=A0ABS4T572_9MICC|nr:hypothetical protein [Nesterenkonia lacusekhoensis]MBP2319592.1 hypothetical protein [Nesterenkonia lacusekhoensis]